jgi:hypothetical protein
MLVATFGYAHQDLAVSTRELRGTRPTQAARWRPFLNSVPSPMAATTDVAVLGPTPLILAISAGGL